MDERQTVLQANPVRTPENQGNDSTTERQSAEKPCNNETVAFDPGQIPVVESHADGLVNQLDSAASLLAAVHRSEMNPGGAAGPEDTPAQAAGVGDAGPSFGSIDESIEDYMAALMQRCQGHSSRTQTKPVPQGISNSAQPATADKRMASGDSDQHSARPHEHAPESRDALDDLREVANTDSRNHIDACLGQRLVFEMHNRLRISLLAALISFAVVGFAHTASSLTFICALMSFIVSIVWGLKYLTLANQLSRLCQLLELDAKSSEVPD